MADRRSSRARLATPAVALPRRSVAFVAALPRRALAAVGALFLAAILSGFALGAVDPSLSEAVSS